MDYTQILNYATKYYLRYYPSRARLIEKIQEKFHPSNKALSDVLHILEDIIVEEQVIDAKIRHYIERWKNISYIKLKLIQKKFDSDIVLWKIQKLIDSGTILGYENTMQKVLLYYEKNKSKNYVRNKLIERPSDRSLVESAIAEIYGYSEAPIIGREYNNMKPKPNLKDFSSKQKFMQKMMSRGFNYGDLREFLDWEDF